MRRNQCAHNIAERRMTIPNAKNQSTFRSAKPSSDHGHHAWPAGRLADAGQCLHKDEVPHRMNVVDLGQTKCIGEYGREQHPECEEIPQRNTFRHETRHKHCNAIRYQKWCVQCAKQCCRIRSICNRVSKRKKQKILSDKSRERRAAAEGIVSKCIYEFFRSVATRVCQHFLPFRRQENKTKQTAFVATIAAVQLSAKPVATKTATATATFDCVPFLLLLFSFAFHLSAPELTKLIRRVSEW